jgi:polar amino acid transport system substrate-binding protein
VHHAIFARRGAPRVAALDELRGKEVVLHGGGIVDELLTARGLGDRLVRVATPADALRGLAAGRHEYAVVAMLPGTYLLEKLRLTNVEMIAGHVAVVDYGYAVRAGNAALLARFTEGLAILKATGRLDEIHARWLGVLEPSGGVTWRGFWRYGAIVFLPLVVGLGGALAWTRSLHHQVRARTASLRREVAERERAVEDLKLHQQQLVQADKMAALGVLVSGVAHEINNPNGLILLATPSVKAFVLDALEVLDDRAGDEGDFEIGGVPYSRARAEVPRLLDQMQDGSRRIKRIVEDLKDFARRQDAPRLEPVDLNVVAQASLRLVENAVRKATGRFEARWGNGPLTVFGDGQRIEQVIVNLVLNACQALPDRDRAIAVSTARDGDRVILRVRDEGAGIAPEHLPRLTDPFFTTKRESGGTGLGLAVSAGIVKEHARRHGRGGRRRDAVPRRDRRSRGRVAGEAPAARAGGRVLPGRRRPAEAAARAGGRGDAPGPRGAAGGGPGNVRELRAMVYDAVSLGTGPVLDLAPFAAASAVPQGGAARPAANPFAGLEPLPTSSSSRWSPRRRPSRSRAGSTTSSSSPSGSCARTRSG